MKSCRPTRWITAFLAGLFLALPAAAQDVSDCDWRSSARNLFEPWEENTRTFANGNVRLALLDTVEPGAVPVHIMVLSPPYDELGTRQCKLVSHAEGFGFNDATFDGMTADYDPSIGLIFSIRVYEFDPGTGMGIPRTLRMTLNQATGEITAVLR